MIFLAKVASKFKGWMAAAGVGLLAVIGFYAKGRADQKKSDDLSQYKAAEKLRTQNGKDKIVFDDSLSNARKSSRKWVSGNTGTKLK